MNLVVAQLKDIDRGEIQVLKQVVELNISSEVGPLGVEGYGLAVGYVAAAHSCLRRAEITKERNYVVRWHMVQEPGDCWEYL